MKSEQLKERGFEYWMQLSEEKKKLYERMYDYQDYFSDMLFKKDAITREYTAVQVSISDSESFEATIGMPEQIERFDYEYINVEVKKLEDCSGSFNLETLTLSIDTDSFDDDSVLLHEMIHLHEYVITDELPLFYYDVVLWSLYKNLRKYIPSLDDVIDSHIYILAEESIERSGGAHDLLFLLKSFDLDIKQGYPLGTVFGYGKLEEFKDIEYKKI